MYRRNSYTFKIDNTNFIFYKEPIYKKKDPSITRNKKIGSPYMLITSALCPDLFMRLGES